MMKRQIRVARVLKYTSYVCECGRQRFDIAQAMQEYSRLFGIPKAGEQVFTMTCPQCGNQYHAVWNPCSALPSLDILKIVTPKWRELKPDAYYSNLECSFPSPGAECKRPASYVIPTTDGETYGCDEHGPIAKGSRMFSEVGA